MVACEVPACAAEVALLILKLCVWGGARGAKAHPKFFSKHYIIGVWSCKNFTCVVFSPPTSKKLSTPLWCLNIHLRTAFFTTRYTSREIWNRSSLIPRPNFCAHQTDSHMHNTACHHQTARWTAHPAACCRIAPTSPRKN